MKKALVNTVCEYMQRYSNVYMLIGDLGYGVMNPIEDNFPDRLINMGICEQNMASVAAGMAMEGDIVFMYSIANFPTFRCLEQIRNDIAYNHANVKIISVGAGFAYGNLGMSHHATEDIAVMRAIPGMMVLSPADPNETVEAVKMAVEADGPVYIRLGRGGEEALSDQPNPLCRGLHMLRNGEKVAILSTGIITKEAVKAADELMKSGIHIAVYSVPMIKPIDEQAVMDLAKKFQYIIIVEEHQKIGGFGGAVAEILATSGSTAKLIPLGIDDSFCAVVGSPDYLRSVYGVDSSAIIHTVESILKWIY